MAKPPETVDRYRIHAETSVEQMGFVLAALTKMGLDNVGYELVTEVNNFKQRHRHDTTGDAFFAEWLTEHPTFSANDVVKHFKGNGRTGGSGYTAIRNLLAKGAIKKSGPGNYQRADVKAIAAPEKKKPHSRAGTAPPRFEIRGIDAIWRHIKNRQKFTVQELQVLFRAQGRQAKSVSPLITQLAKQKRIKLIEPGQYAVRQNAVKAKPVKKVAGDKQKQLQNGADMSGENTTHG